MDACINFTFTSGVFLFYLLFLLLFPTRATKIKGEGNGSPQNQQSNGVVTSDRRRRSKLWIMIMAIWRPPPRDPANDDAGREIPSHAFFSSPSFFGGGVRAPLLFRHQRWSVRLACTFFLGPEFRWSRHFWRWFRDLPTCRLSGSDDKRRICN